jgi:uncharacterized protein
METYVKKKFMKKIEKKFSIKVIFVTECGSRAYNLESNESDYDLRFVYIQNEYDIYKEFVRKKLTSDIFEHGKVQNETFTGKFYMKDQTEVDWQGWDITKAIKHLYEMNPSICEWIFSPIVYYNNPNYEFQQNAQELVKSQKRISPLIRHYLAMGRIHYENYVFQEKEVPVKKYATVARCGIMAKWLLIHELEVFEKDLFYINVFTVLTEIKNYISKKNHKKLLGLLNKKKIHQKDLKTISDESLNEWFETVFYNTDTDLRSIKDSEDYDGQSFKKYNKLIRDYVNKRFSNYLFFNFF